ncbi:MAG: hypothetical protein WEA61_06835 [Anaerolineales bacterium]
MNWTIAFLLLFTALILSMLALRYVRLRRNRAATPYQPAVARIEGGGVKRGLTPPEGAVLLGRPLNVTLTLVIFEMLRKGLLRQIAAEPLTVALAEAIRTQGSGLSAQARGERRRKAAQAIPAALHKYEEPFLELIEASHGMPITELDFGVAIQPLIRYVAGRVRGFSLEETRAYYRLIIERAPREARSDGKLTFERQKVFDRNFGWVLLGDDFGAVLDQPDYSYVPVWMRRSGGLEVERSGSQDQTGLPPGRSFAAWAAEVMAAMEGAVREQDVKLTLGRETDAVTATLLNDVARATWWG